MTFNFQWVVTLFLGVTSIYMLVMNTYAPGATVVSDALVFALAPMIAFLVIRGLWDTRPEFHLVAFFMCLLTMQTVWCGMLR